MLYAVLVTRPSILFCKTGSFEPSYSALYMSSFGDSRANVASFSRILVSLDGTSLYLVTVFSKGCCSENRTRVIV